MFITIKTLLVNWIYEFILQRQISKSNHFCDQKRKTMQNAWFQTVDKDRYKEKPKPFK